MSATVAHLSSVHPRHDVRIFHKQCRTLAKAGYAVSLVVADGRGDQDVEGVRIIDAGAPQAGRLQRMIASARAVYEQARALNAAVYHLHDPELLPLGLRLKREGFRVIFDSHEDYPADILTKPYLNKHARRAVSRTFAMFERYACRKLDFVVAATPAICAKFQRLGCRTVDIKNYPLLEEFDEPSAWQGDRSNVCHIGALTNIRGIPELVNAIALSANGIRLALAGTFTERAAEDRCRASPGWPRVDYHGFVGRSEVRSLLASSFAGIATLLPSPSHIDSLPIKMFEYMSAGIPVIASDFPLWREIIEGSQCGICVDPTKPAAIAAAIDHLHADQQSARAMGERGRAAVLERYNWESEGRKLLYVYESLLGR